MLVGVRHDGCTVGEVESTHRDEVRHNLATCAAAYTCPAGPAAHLWTIICFDIVEIAEHVEMLDLGYVPSFY
jgi:hypothetical protein